MMTILRKHRGWLMIVITVLALPFCLYFVKTDYSRIRQDAFATAYGRTITMVEAQRNARLFGLARELGMDSLVQGLAGTGNDPNQAATAFAINLIVLQHESEVLGIQPTPAELGDFIRNLRGFRGPNGYDPKKYQEFAENILPANGFAGAQIEELATYALSLNKIKDLVTLGLSVSESASKDDFDKAYGRLVVHVVRIKSSDFDKEFKSNE